MQQIMFLILWMMPLTAPARGVHMGKDPSGGINQFLLIVLLLVSVLAVWWWQNKD